MNAFVYGVILQWKLDIRSKSLLITCYIVPLLFFVVMGGIFTSLMPESKNTLIQSMTVMGVSMGALIGLPPSLMEIYGSDIKKAYKANGVPVYLGLVSIMISTFLHLMMMSTIVCIVAPIAFDAALPISIPLYYEALSVYIMVSLSMGGVLGLAMKNQAKLTMVSQVVFLPSILLSGIMFPAEMLPTVLIIAGKLFPASWGYQLMVDHGLSVRNGWPLLVIFLMAGIVCAVLLRRQRTE